MYNIHCICSVLLFLLVNMRFEIMIINIDWVLKKTVPFRLSIAKNRLVKPFCNTYR